MCKFVSSTLSGNAANFYPAAAAHRELPNDQSSPGTAMYLKSIL